MSAALEMTGQIISGEAAQLLYTVPPETLITISPSFRPARLSDQFLVFGLTFLTRVWQQCHPGRPFYDERWVSGVLRHSNLP